MESLAVVAAAVGRSNQRTWSVYDFVAFLWPMWAAAAAELIPQLLSKRMLDWMGPAMRSTVLVVVPEPDSGQQLARHV